MRFNPAFDGLRALAVTLVLGFHAFVPRFSGGYLGVDVFFVLSGFLISTLLLSELDATGSIRVRRFYARRLIRLTPALLFMLATYLAFAPVAWPEVPYSLHLRDAAIALLYASDYTSAIWSIPVYLRHTWSLAVEEHFYLIWPAVLILFYQRMSRRSFAWFLIAAYVFATAWRVYCDLDNGQGYDATYYRFDARLSGLIAGSFLALVGSAKTQLPRFTRDMVALLALVIVAVCTWRFTVGSTLAVTFGMTCIELATLACLYVVTSSSDTVTFRILSNPLLVFIGQMSYGIYLWHYPIFHYLWDHDPWYLTVAVGGIASLVMAIISHFTVERWGRNWLRNIKATV